MDSASIQFVLFGLAIAILSNFSRSAAWRSAVLMLASLTFLGLVAVHPITLLPLAGFLALGYVGVQISQRTGSRWMAFTVTLILLIYIWLKRYTFLPENIFLRFPYLTLGLSYIFFRVLHLVIDSGSESQKPRISLFNYLLYTINFTTIVSGPIQRYENFAHDQFAEEPPPLHPGIVGLQFERIIRGLFKVNVLGMLLQNMQEDTLELLTQPMPESVKLIAAFRLILIYPFFLYCNFSGYIDIVIALARLMRMQLPENFDRPFSASSFLDFWNRWHITLSTWLKTYVYNPSLLTLMRRITLRAIEPFLGVFCFFVTFFLVGIWHGRTSEFAIFGILNGGGVAGNKLWQMSLTNWLGRKGYKALAANAVYIAFGRGLTFSWFAFATFWFWASWKELGAIFTSIGVIAWLTVWLAVWLTATAILAVWEWLRNRLMSWKSSDGPVFLGRYARVIYATVMGFTFLIVNLLLNQPAPGIVYKKF